MSSLKLKGKIILPMVAVLVFIVITPMIYSTIQMLNISESIYDQKLDLTVNAVTNYLDMRAHDTRAAAEAVAQYSRIITSMQNRDIEYLFPLLAPIIESHQMSYLILTDANGVVLARSYNPGDYGDDISHIKSIDNALKSKWIVTEYEEFEISKLSLRTIAPVYADDDTFIGLVAAGIRFDTDEMVDYLKDVFQADFTVFIGDMRVATSIKRDGGRITGTRLTDPEVLNTVFGQRQAFSGRGEIAGELYSTHYKPIINPENEVYGMLFVGTSNAATQARIAGTIFAGAAIGFTGLAAAIFILLFITSKITKSVSTLMNTVSEVSRGNININVNRRNVPKDEIGKLTLDIYELIDVIKSMINDLTLVNHVVNTEGDLDYQIDASKYQGSYKEMIDSINKLVKTFSEEITLILGAIKEIGEGNFHTNFKWLPGKKASFNLQLTTLMNQFNGINTEIVLLTKNINEGNLNSKANADKFHGEWRNLLEDLNVLIDAISGPVKDVMSALSELKAANFKYRVTSEYQGDFGTMVNGINESFEATDSYITEVSGILGDMASGDLTNEIKRDYVGQFTEIRESINSIAHSLNATISEISSSSEQVMAGSSQVSSSAIGLAQGATEQASAVQNLTESVAEVKRQIIENTENTQQSAKLAKESKHNAELGNVEMRELMKAMEGILESSNKISQIIKTIEDIAFQTNLLALNAAVEAARAGEHGKGFAVVAEEVRGLAGRSRDAAKITSELINESIMRVEEGTKGAKATADTLNNIVRNVVDVAEVLDKIHDAGNNQADAINKINTGVNQIAQIVQSNTATSEESAATSEELSSQAEMLKQMIAFFKTK